MEKIITGLVEQIPSLAVLCFIVICFLKFLDGLKKTFEQMYREGLETIKANTEVLGKTVKSIEECQRVQIDFKQFSNRD